MTALTQSHKNMVLFAGTYPKSIKNDLHNVAKDLNLTILPASIGAFKSGERFCELYPGQKETFAQNKADIAGANVHVVLSMNSNPDKFFFDAINIVETIADCDPATIHVVMPFAPFARQDRAFDKRFVSRMAKTFPKHLKTAGADMITTIDVHSDDAERAYINCFGADNVQFLSMLYPFSHKVKTLGNSQDRVVFGAPDGGDKPDDVAQRKARRIAKSLYGSQMDPQKHMFFITKRHKGINTTEVMNLQGDVKDAQAVILDDMADTGGTLVNGARALKNAGAKKVIATFTHPILSGNSLSRLTSPTIEDKENPIDMLITTDSIMGIYAKAKRLTDDQRSRLHILPTAALVSGALRMRM
jgi:ribose-phosphate pyrophosphokinase